MSAERQAQARDEFRAAFWSARSLLYMAGFFSLFVNLLMLTGPLFMLQVYDRVLSSGSVPTLIALLGLCAGLFALMGVLDFLRGRILASAGARFQATLDGRVFEGVLRRSVAPSERSKPSMALRDLEAVQSFLAGPAPLGFFDAPWTPIYIGVIFLFHPILGRFSVGAGIVLFTIASINQFLTRNQEAEWRKSNALSEKIAESFRRDAETVRAMGMGRTARNLWGKARSRSLDAQIVHSNRAGFFQVFSRTFRMFLQSLILAVGAWLVVQQEITPGIMIASSIMMGRALAPIDQVIANWKGFSRARAGMKSLKEFLAQTPLPEQKTELPDPKAKIAVSNLSVITPGMQKPYVQKINFSIEPGTAVGVIGPSASGKSTLARGLVGIWPAKEGEIRLDGASLDQWNDETLGRKIGYLPQEVSLFAGTVAENIARFQPGANEAKIVEAAKRAGGHEMILKLPKGYDTEIGDGGSQLSGGQRQRIGLARALYGDAILLVFDEPNSNLDAEGEMSLVAAIEDAKKRGCAVIVMAHRPSAIAACEMLLVMRDGQQHAFGPRNEVLQMATRKSGQVVPLNRPELNVGTQA